MGAIGSGRRWRRRCRCRCCCCRWQKSEIVTLLQVAACCVVSCCVLFCFVLLGFFFSSALSLLPYAIDLRIASAILQLPHATCHNRQLAIGMRHGCAPIVPSQDSWQRQWHLINASIGLLLLPLPVLLLSPLPAFLTALSLSICLFLRPICSSS